MNEKSNQENSWFANINLLVWTIFYYGCYRTRIACRFIIVDFGFSCCIFAYAGNHLSFCGRMKKHKYKIRAFQCLDCGSKTYAAKSAGRMTAPGHMKYLWCAHCKEVKNMTQIEWKGASLWPGKRVHRLLWEMDKNYKYYKDHGICPQCGVREHAPGRVRCEICLAQNAESTARKRSNENDSEYDARIKKMRYYNRSTRSERKENGKCIWCGKPLSAYSSCFCPDCRVKNQKNNERHKSGIPRSELPLYGICYRCGKNPVISGRKLCQTCYEQSVSALKSAEKSEKTAERRNYIRQQNNLIFGR